jgi:hypothetical protein
MLDHNGHIVEQEPCVKTLFVEADLGSLYKEPATWDQFDEIVDRIMMEDEEPSRNIDVLICKVSSFSLSIKERAILSNALMAFEATTIDKSTCDIFEVQLRDAIEEGFSTLLAVRAGQTRGVSAEHLAKIWRISHDDAVWMLEVTTQLLHTNDGSSYLVMLAWMIVQWDTRNFGQPSLMTLCLQPKRQKACEGIPVPSYLSRTKGLWQCIRCGRRVNTSLR